MDSHTSRAEILKLPVGDRLRLIEEIWDSLETGAVPLPLPEWHKAELDQRLAAHDADPSASLPWTDVKAEILANLSK